MAGALARRRGAQKEHANCRYSKREGELWIAEFSLQEDY